MNFLAHLYIAEATDTSFAGALLGDFVRGRLDGSLAPEIETGVRLHRRVDSYTDAHPAVRNAFARLEPPFRRYAGILVDVYFDHLLARQWPRFHHRPLASFAERAGERLRREWPAHGAPFPAARLTGLPERLTSYRRPAGIDEALASLDRRLTRRSPLTRALPELAAHDAGLAADFEAFFPELLTFARREAR